jgi:hypothetical protein
MSFAPGQFITAQRLNRLQNKVYRAKCSSALSGVQTDQDIPGATVTFDTETDNAMIYVWWSCDARQTAATSGQIACKALLDGVASDAFALFQGAPGASGAGEKATVANTMDFTAATAGSHTVKLQVTQTANNQTNIYASVMVMVEEVV